MMSDTQFFILTPAYNCAQKIENTLKSVAFQTYKNWSMAVVDDTSTDNTKNAVLRLARQLGVSDRVKVIRREEKYGEVRNTLDVCLSLDDDVVVVRLDAGDWITDMGCFQILNMIYKSHDPAVLWTNQRWSWTNYSICGPIDPSTSVYDQKWSSSHLKTFRARELKDLNEKNFKDNEGNWITIGCDQAIFLPMMERARLADRPLIYLPLVMYHYDIELDNPNLFTQKRSIDQKMSAEKIRERGFIT